MKDVELDQVISKYYNELSETELEIAKYVMRSKKDMKEISITELAEKTYTSKSSVLRFVQKLGFSGFIEFKYLIDWEGNSDSLSYTETDVSYFTEKILDYLTTFEYRRLFDLINESENIFLIATGLSQRYQAQTLQRDFLKAGKNMSMLPAGTNTDLTQAVIEKLTKKDLLIVISTSGENEVLKEMLSVPILKEVPLFSITSHTKNWLQEKSTLSLCLGLNEESNGVYQFNSTYVHLVIDFLKIEYERYLKEESKRKLSKENKI